jgi:hypothetical protein
MRCCPGFLPRNDSATALNEFDSASALALTASRRIRLSRDDIVDIACSLVKPRKGHKTPVRSVVAAFADNRRADWGPLCQPGFPLLSGE